MFESSGSFTPSPSLLLSQMSDPSAMLSSLCAPFLKSGEANTESFGISLVRSLIPNIKRSLISSEETAFASLPRLVKLSIDNLGDDGLNLVTNEILPEVVDLYLSDSSFLGLYCESVSSIPAKYRDDILVESITRNSISADYRLRALAASIVSLVRRHNRVITQFRQLSMDKSSHVRITVVKSLPNCNFDSPIIDSIVFEAANDVSIEVRNAIAEEIGYIAPHLTELYIQLLEDLSTQASALKCACAMANYSGFSIFFESYLKVIETYPDKVAATLLQISPFVDPSEHRLLYKCAKRLRHAEKFITNLYQFTRVFTNRERFLKFFEFLDPINGASNSSSLSSISSTSTSSSSSGNSQNASNSSWYERLLYCEQLQHFIDDFGIKTLPYALSFAYDSVTVVRNQSVFALTALVKKCPETVPAVMALMGAHWAQRVVLAKVALNVNDNNADFLEVRAALKNDRDPHVRAQFDPQNSTLAGD